MRPGTRLSGRDKLMYDSADRAMLNLVLEDSIRNVGASGSHILAPLARYDREHGGDLIHTLATYLTLGCNASRTATCLYLHRSGLLYRLRRIEQLLDVQLSDFRDRVALEIIVVAMQSRLAPNLDSVALLAQGEA